MNINSSESSNSFSAVITTFHACSPYIRVSVIKLGAVVTREYHVVPWHRVVSHLSSSITFNKSLKLRVDSYWLLNAWMHVQYHKSNSFSSDEDGCDIVDGNLQGTYLNEMYPLGEFPMLLKTTLLSTHFSDSWVRHIDDDSTFDIFHMSRACQCNFNVLFMLQGFCSIPTRVVTICLYQHILTNNLSTLNTFINISMLIKAYHYYYI